MVISHEVDPGKEFAKAVKAAIKDVEDLTIPLTLITKSWFQSNKFIFQVKGSSGKYADLSGDSEKGYKEWKNRNAGFVYPVLKLSGTLEKALTNPGGDSIALVVNKKTLVLGTKDLLTSGALKNASGLKSRKYRVSWHQFGTKKMPARPPVLIGTEQTAPEPLNKRAQLWIQTLENYVLQRAMQLGTVTR